MNPSPHSLPLYGIKQPDVLQKIIILLLVFHAKKERNLKGFETTEPLKVHGDGKKIRREEKLYVNALAFSQIILTKFFASKSKVSRGERNIFAREFKGIEIYFFSHLIFSITMSL